MNIKFPKIFSQNVQKNRLTKTILENNNNFNILFIQELLWLIIHNISNFISKEGEDIIKASNYLS